MKPEQEFYLNEIKRIYHDEGTEGKAAVWTVAIVGIAVVVGLGALALWLA